MEISILFHERIVQAVNVAIIFAGITLNIIFILRGQAEFKDLVLGFDCVEDQIRVGARNVPRSVVLLVTLIYFDKFRSCAIFAKFIGKKLNFALLIIYTIAFWPG